MTTGTIVADTARQAREMLRERGLSVQTMAPARPEPVGSFLARRRGRRVQPEITEFVRELATLLQAGFPLLSALETLLQQHGRRLRLVLQHLCAAVSAGRGLAEAMAEQPAYFDALCISIVRVGDETGSLETALARLADFREKGHRLRSQLVTALIYPALVCGVGLAVMTFLMTFVVPNLLSTLVQAGRELPAVTRAVKGMSDFLIHGWWAILIAAACIVAGMRMVLRTARGRMAAHRLLLRLPVLGNLIQKETISRMAVVLAALLQSGLNFVEAIRITRDTVHNDVFRRALVVYEEAVIAGKDVAAPLAQSGVFSPMVVQMLAVGQQAGMLEEMLERLAAAYDRQVTVATQRLAAVLEPALILLLAVQVGFVAFATILPILEASNVF